MITTANEPKVRLRERVIVIHQRYAGRMSHHIPVTFIDLGKQVETRLAVQLRWRLHYATAQSGRSVAYCFLSMLFGTPVKKECV